MGGGIFMAGVVQVICGKQRKLKFAAKFYEIFFNAGFNINAMVH